MSAKPKYPLPDREWEALMMAVIDGYLGDEENESACIAVEKIRNERYALIARLERKEK